MDTLVVHVLNALLYASVMFLIAGGLSLIYGVMRIVNLAHGNLYALGAYVAAWAMGRLGAGAPMPVLYLVRPASVRLQIRSSLSISTSAARSRSRRCCGRSIVARRSISSSSPSACC